MQRDLSAQAAAIRTRADLVAFLHALIADYQQHAGAWQHSRIHGCLDVMAALLEEDDAPWYLEGGWPEQPDWRIIGELLLRPRYQE